MFILVCIDILSNVKVLFSELFDFLHHQLEIFEHCLAEIDFGIIEQKRKRILVVEAALTAEPIDEFEDCRSLTLFISQALV